MKTGIIVAMAALGMAIFAAPNAHGWWHRGPEVNQRFSGSSFTIDTDADTGNASSLQDLIAKGQPGTAHTEAQTVIGPVGPDDRCPAQYPFGADVISQSIVQTYNDGSLLTASTAPGGFVCSDGVVFTAEVTGTITGGTQRFKGASGTFKADAFVENAGMSGHFTADLD